MIEATMSVERQNRFNDQAADVQYEKIWWALRKGEAGKWLLISEHRYSRNRIAGALGLALRQRLDKDFAVWRVSDGQRERHPYEEIKERLGVTANVVDSRTRWKGTGPTMTGPAHEEVQITGDLSILVGDKQAAADKGVWVNRRVTLALRLAGDEKSLILQTIQVAE